MFSQLDIFKQLFKTSANVSKIIRLRQALTVARLHQHFLVQSPFLMINRYRADFCLISGQSASAVLYAFPDCVKPIAENIYTVEIHRAFIHIR